MAFDTSVKKSLFKDIVRDMRAKEYETAIMSDGTFGVVENWIPTGSIVFDKVLTAGVTGKPVVPFGRIVSVEGLNQSGKTTSMLHTVKEAQRVGAIPVILDNEEKLDTSLAQQMGVDLDRCIIDSADCIEETFEKIHNVIEIILEHAPDKLVIIFWDSLGATPAEAELAEKGGMSVAARVVGSELRKAVIRLKRTQTCLWINNHIYRDPKVKFGDPWKPYGGEKPLLQATWRMRLIKKSMIKEGGLIVGSVIEIRNLKNNTSMPFQRAIGHIIHGEGWSNAYTAYDLAKKKRIPGVTGGGQASCEITLDGEELKWKGWNQFKEKVVPSSKFPLLVALAKDAVSFDLKVGKDEDDDGDDSDD